MKDIDTETSVVWPSWCYSDDIRKKLLKPVADIAKDTLVCEPDILILPPIAGAPTKQKRLAAADLTPSPSDRSEGHSKPYCSRLSSSRAINDKMLSERSMLLSGYNNTSIDSVKNSCEQSKTPTPPLSAAQAAALTVTPTTTAAAAAAYLYLEKVKNERMSPRVTAAQIDSLKDAIMESSAAAAAVAAAMVNNNNCSSINNNNNHNNNSCSSNHSNNSNSVLGPNPIGNSLSNASDKLHSHSLPSSIGQQQLSSAMHMNSNHVKRERLSPNATNGDLQSAISRSRSTTPSSFRGTSPQLSVHSSPTETVVPMHNLSTNLLNSIQQAAASSSGRHNSINFSSGAVANPNSGLPSDFSTRNYSDFMRSLAAKYNNTNPNDSSNSRRQAFFDANANNATKKTSTTTATKASYPAPSSSTSISKEVTITTISSLPPPPPLSTGAISPGESALTHTQQSQMAAAAVASAAAANAASAGGSVSPFMTSFLSSLPFAQGIFPPLIDMSGTQALITLARAAKESEIHNILQLAQNTTKRSTANVSPSPSPSLSMALQQAAQFISPALIYSAQLQKQQLVSRQSSPRSTNITNSSSSSANAVNSKNAGEKRNASPLDLSSQPPASKRFKAESTSSQSSSDGLLDVTIKRRASTSTATTTPSPPPMNEKSSSPFGPAPAEATTAAFAPPTLRSSASTTPVAYAGVADVRQCQAHSEEVNSWTVHDVCSFVGSIDICAEYVKHFRDQSIDGSGLPLLTEDHLVNSLGMKLGPALKLRSMLAKKLGGPCPCVTCVAQAQQMLALQTGAGITVPTGSGGALNATAVITAPESGSCNSLLPKSTTMPNMAATLVGNNGGGNNSSSNNCSAVNKNDSTTAVATTTTTTTTSSTNVNAAPSYSSVEGGTSIATGNSNCIINIATFSPPPSAYSNCSNNYNHNMGGGSSSKSATSNRSDSGGSSSSNS